MAEADKSPRTSRQLTAPELFREASRLIERGLIQLDMREYPCLECGRRDFKQREHARVYEQFTDTPTKLKNAAAKLDDMPGGFVPVTEAR